MSVSHGLLNPLSYFRVAVVPVIMWLLVEAQDVPHASTWAALLFLAAALTDLLDGYLARRWKASTTYGSFLDTTADKLLVSGALISLVAVNRASPWASLIIISRELVILGLRAAVAARGEVFPPSRWGKAKANVQFAAIFVAMLRFGPRLGGLLLDEWLMWLAAVASLVSGAEYMTRFGASLSQRDKS